MGWLDWLRGRNGPPLPASATDAGLGVPNAFQDEVEAVLRTLADVGEVRRPVGTGALAFNIGRGEELLYLHHLFAEVRDLDEASRAGRIEYVLRAVLEKEREESWGDACRRVLPVIRPGTYGAYLSEKKELVPQPVRRACLPVLSELLAVDNPKSLMYVTSRHLEDWGVSESEVTEAAHENAEQLGATELELYLDRMGGIMACPGEDVYASTRLLLPGWLAALSSKVSGNVLVIAPERSTLLVAGDADPEAVRWMAETAQREWKASTRALSPVVYTTAESALVVPYRRPESDALGRLLRRGEGLLLSSEYGEQQQLLEQIHARDGADLFVAKASLVEREDGCARSFCVWTDGVETLLPRTDAVIVQSRPDVRKDAWRAFLPFERARELTLGVWSSAGVPAGPERFRTPARVDPALRAQLEAAAVPFEQI